ncbi:MAG: potassium/proton antiporter [Dermatophilus congolensis]|nr:potassium/proton antiporter [Dermatophilus congolensis]
MGGSLGTLNVDALGPILLISALVLIVAVAAVRLSVRTGLPSLLLYLAIGLALGDAGLGLHFESLGLSRFLGYVALVFILIEGGITTRWSDIRKSVAPAALLATVGVVVSIVVVAAAAHLLLGIQLHVALLIGAILSSTDAAAVFSVLREVNPSRRLSGVLEAESGFNDAPVVLVVVALSDHLARGGTDLPVTLIVLLVLAELVGGAFIGVGIGWAAGRVMAQLGSTASGLFPIGVIAWTLLSYGLAALTHTSGFLAVYLCALVLGNTQLPHRTTTRGFAEALGWLAQIGLFVMLGLLTTPAELATQFAPAIVLGAVLLLLARPLSVLASTVWFGFGVRDQIFLSFAGLRGAVPIVLATVPVITGVRGVEWIFNLVFVLVIVFTVVQALPMPYVVRWLGVVDQAEPHDVDIDSTPLERAGAELIDITVGRNSGLRGMSVRELRLPGRADVSMIVRDGETIVPDDEWVFYTNDQVLLVCPTKHRTAVTTRILAIDRHGRLAGWAPGEAAYHRKLHTRGPIGRPERTRDDQV